MVGALFGLLSAVCIGLTDLFGRRVVAASSATTAATVIQLIAAVTALATLVVLGGGLVVADLVRGGLSGIGLGVGLVCYFVGVSRSSATVVSPVTATLAAVIPFAYAAIVGQTPSAVALAGAAVAFVGVAVITAGDGVASRVRAGLFWGLASGAGYGFGLAILVDIGSGSGAWPAVSQRLIALVFLLIVARQVGEPVAPPMSVRTTALLAGVFSGLASVLILVAVTADPTEAVVTSSMFPAASVAIGRLWFGDSVRPMQIAGLVIVICGVVAVVAG